MTGYYLVKAGQFHRVEHHLTCGGRLMPPVAKLDHETDPPDGNSHHADSDAKIGCRVDRTGDNPEDASEDDTERNQIAEHCVAHQPKPDLSRQTTLAVGLLGQTQLPPMHQLKLLRLSPNAREKTPAPYGHRGFFIARSPACQAA